MFDEMFVSWFDCEFLLWDERASGFLTCLRDRREKQMINKDFVWCQNFGSIEDSSLSLIQYSCLQRWVLKSSGKL
jgi:hypothetical protein